MPNDVYPPDFSTPVGLIRSLVPDIEPLEDPADLSAEPSYIFSDAHLQAYLVMARDNVKRAAALALNTLATSEALILKVLKSDDRQTDGAKLADSIGNRAQMLLAEAEADELEDLYDGFDIVTPRFIPETWEMY